MGHFCDYIGKLTLHGNEIVHEVTAIWKNKKELVYEEHEDGTNYCRYIYNNYHYGYVVVFPNEKLNYYYGYNIQQEEELDNCSRLGLTISWKTKEEDLKEISKARPELKYLINKFNGTATQFIDIVNIYKKNPSIESLVGLNLNNIALDKRLEKLTKSKRTEVINFIKNNKVDSDVNLSTILFAIKHKLTIDGARLYASNHYNYKLCNYLIKHNINNHEYNDYIIMCEKLNKDLKDEYWLYPKDFMERHNLVINQLEAIKKAEELKNEKGVKRVGKLLSHNNVEINNYYIYIPDSIVDIQNQADILHQCLITCDYPSKVAKKQSVLVFIKKEDKPIATAEIDYDKKLIQFYGDEIDRKNCKPSEEVTNVFNQWLSNAMIYKKGKVTNENRRI